MRKLIQIFNKSGKMALSAMQAVGITAVVGAAGIGAWQYLSGPADDNTAFSPSQYTTSGEVVYVAGANTGGYTGGSYGGKSESAVQVSGRTLQLLDRQAQAEKIAQEMEDNSYAYSEQEAYHMGGTEGLGMGANYVSDANSATDPTTAMQQSMAGMQDMMNRAQQQISGVAAAGKNASGKEGKPQEGKGGVPTLASIAPNWSNGAGGNGGGSSFVLQDSSQTGGARNGSGQGGSGAQDASSAIANAQAEAARMMEGARIRGRSSFGNTSGLSNDRDASVAGGRRGRRGQSDLEDIQKRSADAAANKNRSNTEGARAFLAGGSLSGGMIIASDNFVTGEGQSSKDFDTSNTAHLRGIHDWSDEQDDTSDLRDADRSELLWLMIGATVATLALMLVIALTKDLPPYGWIAALAATVAIAALIVALAVKVYRYQDSWGWDGMPISGLAVISLLGFGAVAAWTFLGDALFSIGMKVAEFLGMGAGPVVGTGILGGTAGAGAAGTAGSALGTRK